jgi:acyl-CoA synthetase (NDP forming)
MRSLDELADTIELFSSPRRVRRGDGIASVHDSGGERAMFVDLAGDLGVPFASVSDATIARIADTLDPGMESSNPLDAWGTGIDGDRIFHEAFAAFADDPAVSASVFCVDMTLQGEPYDEGYLLLAREAYDETSEPFCVLSNLASAVTQHEIRMLRDAGIPVLEGTENGLRALSHLLDDAAFRARPVVEPGAPADHAVRARWRDRLAAGVPVSELDGLTLLEEYGLDVAAARPASSAQRAVDAATAIGFPVVLKTAAPGVTHKSDVDGVRVGLGDGDAVRAAYEDVSSRLGPDVTVAAMVPPGVEMALGLITDPTFGPLVLVGAGGVLVEVLHDRALALPPIDATAAHGMLDRLAVRPILDGVRGAEAADVEALANAIERLSVLATDLGDVIAALDVNPVIVGPKGCVAVDALVELPRD